MRFRRSRQEEAQVNLTPLIDVVFLLLIFFMVSTTFTRETQLQIDLPESSSDAVLGDERPIEIQVDAQGQYAV
ncbi:MAG: biopolymer transporter ExbD, partial [Saccharospirillum sp.]